MPPMIRLVSCLKSVHLSVLRVHLFSNTLTRTIGSAVATVYINILTMFIYFSYSPPFTALLFSPIQLRLPQMRCFHAQFLIHHRQSQQIKMLNSKTIILHSSRSVLFLTKCKSYYNSFVVAGFICGVIGKNYNKHTGRTYRRSR